MDDRIEYFERMLADNPDNPTGLLALANEYQKAGRDEDEAAILERYLAVQSDDEGNAYARLGNVLSNLGRTDEARAAYERASPSRRSTATAGWPKTSGSPSFNSTNSKEGGFVTVSVHRRYHPLTPLAR